MLDPPFVKGLLFRFLWSLSSIASISLLYSLLRFIFFHSLPCCFHSGFFPDVLFSAQYLFDGT